MPIVEVYSREEDQYRQLIRVIAGAVLDNLTLLSTASRKEFDREDALKCAEAVFSAMEDRYLIEEKASLFGGALIAVDGKRYRLVEE